MSFFCLYSHGWSRVEEEGGWSREEEEGGWSRVEEEEEEGG